jgi:hypothetical protein
MSGQHLDRYDPVGADVEGQPHLAHAAAAQQLDQAVASERRAVHGPTLSIPTAFVEQTGNCHSGQGPTT